MFLRSSREIHGETEINRGINSTRFSIIIQHPSQNHLMQLVPALSALLPSHPTPALNSRIALPRPTGGHQGLGLAPWSAGLAAGVALRAARAGRRAEGAEAAAKRQLLLLCAAGNRGFSAKEAEKKEVNKLLEQLAGNFRPPTDGRQRQDALRGRWRLIYTTSADLTSLETLPLPGWQTGRVGQSFLTSRFARNEIDFFSPLNSKVTQLVNCTWKLPEPLKEDFFVQLVFKYSSTELDNVAGWPVPAPALNLPLPPAAGTFQVAYVDEDLLVQRTRLGTSSVNVLVKESS